MDNMMWSKARDLVRYTTGFLRHVSWLYDQKRIGYVDGAYPSEIDRKTAREELIFAGFSPRSADTYLGIVGISKRVEQFTKLLANK